ncbi:pre-mRNA-splicing factor ATP-dependent RNA helicase PRP43 [Amanita rubescens]|nr:pre-mRNA-splicing factor ATP-dependent RNA helicase PRP43 [Amanita rubescens]
MFCNRPTSTAESTTVHSPQSLTQFSKRQIVIVTGETGCGKTTQWKGKMIAVTQPRRVTTISVASRVASEMDVELGKEVGYSIRFDEKTTAGTTFIRYMTDGKLLEEAMYDPDFRRYSTIIIDEAHERTIATDILLVLLRSVAKKRPDLKIIIMSATLDAPLSYPVEINYVKETPEDYVKKAIKVVLHIHTSDEQGDILLFLTGEDEIEVTCQRINIAVDAIRKREPKTGPVDCIPLYSLLTREKQQKIFDPPPVNRVQGGQAGRKVIVATNIAETSLTIDGIYFVIDCGFSKYKIHHPSLRMEYLRVKKISKASAQQRAGRAGRTGPGRCYRLYTEDEYNDMAEKTRPEVLNIDLSDAVLKLLTIGIKADDIANFDFIDPPSSERITCALEKLKELGALDEKRLTHMGRMMAEFPLGPQLSKALIESVRLRSADKMLTIAAMLSVPSVWRRPYGEPEADGVLAKFVVQSGDHLTLLNVFDQYMKNSCSEEWAKKNYLSANSLEEAKKVREQLEEKLNSRYPVLKSDNGLLNDVVKALVCGFYMQAAVRNSRNGNYIRVNDGMEVKLHPKSGLRGECAPKWIIYNELVRNTTPYLRTVTAIQPEWLFEVSPQYYNLEAFTNEAVKSELLLALG